MRPEPWQTTLSGQLADDRQTRTDAMGRIMHRRQAGPVVGPAVHILLMAAAEELNAAGVAAFVVQFLHEKILAAVNHPSPSSCRILPVLRWASQSCLSSSSVVPIGTVQATCLPACSAARL